MNKIDRSTTMINDDSTDNTLLRAENSLMVLKSHLNPREDVFNPNLNTTNCSFE